MDADIIIGLRIGFIGLGVTFLALGLLSIVMRYLPRIFPPKKEQPTQRAAMEETSIDQQLEEMAVALAVGICLLEDQYALDYQDPNLGKLLETH